MGEARGFMGNVVLIWGNINSNNAANDIVCLSSASVSSAPERRSQTKTQMIDHALKRLRLRRASCHRYAD